MRVYSRPDARTRAAAWAPRCGPSRARRSKGGGGKCPNPDFLGFTKTQRFLRCSWGVFFHVLLYEMKGSGGALEVMRQCPCSRRALHYTTLYYTTLHYTILYYTVI